MVYVYKLMTAGAVLCCMPSASVCTRAYVPAVQWWPWQAADATYMWHHRFATCCNANIRYLSSNPCWRGGPKASMPMLVRHTFTNMIPAYAAEFADWSMHRSPWRQVKLMLTS